MAGAYGKQRRKPAPNGNADFRKIFPSMTTRERFVRVLIGEKVDRVPFIKVFGTTNAVLPSWEKENPGLSSCIDRLIGFEGAYRGWQTTPVNLSLSGLAAPVVLEENEAYTIRQEAHGAVVRQEKTGDYHQRVLRYPVQNRKDWERIKAAYLSPEDPGRFPENWPQLVAQYRQRDYPLQLTHGGVYGFPRTLLGDENLCYAFYDDPGLVRDILETYTEMAIAVWSRMVKEVEFDLIECWEDMASRNGSLVSPGTFREFLKPQYEKIAAFAKSHGIKIILVDSDGFIEELTGLMLESGVTALYPYEVGAGNDLDRVRQHYPEVGIIGGLEKNTMAQGQDAVEKEMEKAARHIQKGRYIPGPDHFPLSNISFEQYRYFMERLRQVVLTTTPPRCRE